MTSQKCHYIKKIFVLRICFSSQHMCIQRYFNLEGERGGQVKRGWGGRGEVAECFMLAKQVNQTKSSSEFAWKNLQK